MYYSCHMPNDILENLVRTFATAVVEFYSDPENVRKFEEWRKNHGHDDQTRDQQTEQMVDQ